MRKILPYILLFLFVSCQNGLQIEKRRYLKGYHISWAQKRHVKETKAADVDKKNSQLKDGATQKPDKKEELVSDAQVENSSRIPEHSQTGFEPNGSKPDPNTGTFSSGKPNGLNEALPLFLKPDPFDPTLTGSLLLLSLLGGTFFLPRLRITRKLAGYGARNNKMAILITAGMTAILLPLAVSTGSMLNDLGIAIPDWFNGFALAGLLGGVFFYPRSTSKDRGYMFSFLRRKTCDAGIMFGTALLLMSFGNNPNNSRIFPLIDTVNQTQKDSVLCDSAKTIILSESVGSRIDSEEKEKYRLFPYWKNDKFGFAEICKKDDGTYVLLGKMKTGSVEQIQLKESDIIALREQISRHDSGNADPKIIVNPDPKPDKNVKYIKNDRNAANKTALSVLYALITAALIFGVLALTCALGCEGYAVASVLVLIGGTTGVIALAIAMFRSVGKKKNPYYVKP